MKLMGRLARVLIVEDEAIIGLAIKRLLGASGYEIAALVATANQAIRAVETSSPDLVLMDIHIKGDKDGIETALEIRRNFHLPVVFVTAHADKKALERARQTEPFGYIVKPISALSLTSTIEMALHKHRIEQQLERHRTWLTTILQGIPDAVLVTDLAGDVQFLNSAAEDLTGRERAEVVGKPIDSALSLFCGEQSNLASHLMDKAEWGDCVSLPQNTRLRVPIQQAGIAVEGDVAMSYTDGQPAGAIFTLRDVSRREQEEKIAQYEERMLALGRLTSGIEGDFNSLHNLLSNTAHELAQLVARLPGPEGAALRDKTDTIARASELGLLMTGQLSQLNAPLSVRATFVSASGVVASATPLLNKLCGRSLQVDIHLTDQSTLILCHPGRLQTLLLNVFLNARERMAGSGRIRISTQQAGEMVSILFELEHLGAPAWQPLSFPLEMENPDFSLSIAQAIVAAMQGSIVFKLLSETQGTLEIILPLQHASQDLVDGLNRLGSVLIVGSDLHILGQIEAQLEESRYAVIRCSSVAEALLLCQLHDSKIDCVIADGDSVSSPNRRKLRTFFESRNSLTQFVRLVSRKQASEQGWQSRLKSRQLSSPEELSGLLRPSPNKLAMRAVGR
jgi:PAS domain S-box-containing protein